MKIRLSKFIAIACVAAMTVGQLQVSAVDLKEKVHQNEISANDSSSTSTENDCIYIDNSGKYYTEENGEIIYLDKVAFTTTDADDIDTVAADYDLPTEVVASLENAVANLEYGDEVTLFVPTGNSGNNNKLKSSSGSWGGTYNYTYQGNTFSIKNYYISTTKSTETVKVKNGKNAYSTAQSIKSWAVLAGTTIIGTVNVGASSAISVADILISEGLSRSVTGSNSDYLEASLNYTTTEKQTYVNMSSGWTLCYVSYQSTVNFIRWHFYGYNNDDDVADKVIYNERFYSDRYNDSDKAAVCSTSDLSDPTLFVKIGTKYFYMDP